MYNKDIFNNLLTTLWIVSDFKYLFHTSTFHLNSPLLPQENEHIGTRKQCQEQRQEVKCIAHLIKNSWKVQQQTDGQTDQVAASLCHVFTRLSLKTQQMNHQIFSINQTTVLLALFSLKCSAGIGSSTTHDPD